MMTGSISKEKIDENIILVELAAKAIGIEGQWNSTFDYIEMRDAGTVTRRWNPLLDNCDALLLAEQLNIQIVLDRNFSTAQYFDELSPSGVKFVERNVDFGCNSAAIRSAIVRAAAHAGVK